MDDRIARPSIRRRALLQAGAGLALGATSASRAQSPAPAGPPVRLVVPFTPGTTPDLCARAVQAKLQDALGRTVVVENRPGASGMIGMDAVNKAAPDGSTLLFGTNTALTLPFVYAKVPFDVLAGFTPITMLGYTNFALAVHPSLPARNLKELKAWVAAQPAPVDYASPGKGTFQHLSTESIAHLAGLRLNHVPYRGSAPALADVLGGHVKIGLMPLHVAAPHAAEGKLALIGTTSPQRDKAVKVPTLAEEGLSDLDVEAWYAVWGPPGMARETVDRVNAAIRGALAQADVAAALSKSGVDVVTSTPDELARTAQAEHAKWGKLIRQIKLPLE